MPPRQRTKRTIEQVAEDAAKKIKSFEIAQDADLVLAPCRKLRAALRQETSDLTGAPRTATAAAVREDIVEVSELSSSQVMDGMEAIALQIASQVLQKQGFQMEIPSRAASNQVYIAEWDRIVLGNKTGTRSFLNVKVQHCVVLRCFVMMMMMLLSSCIVPQGMAYAMLVLESGLYCWSLFVSIVDLPV
jgi:hypothetical protein